MNTLRSHYNVQVRRNEAGEISLAVAPGTWEAETIDLAAGAGLRQAVDDGHQLKKDEERMVRDPVLQLRHATNRVLADRTKPQERVVFEGIAAGVVLEGLGALTLNARDSRVHFDNDPRSQAKKEAYESETTLQEQRAAAAEAVEAEILDQGMALGQQAMASRPTANQGQGLNT